MLLGIKFIKDLEWLVFIVHLASEIHLHFGGEISTGGVTCGTMTWRGKPTLNVDNNFQQHPRGSLRKKQQAHTCLPFSLSASINATMISADTRLYFLLLNMDSIQVTLQAFPVFQPQIGTPEAFSFLGWATAKFSASLVCSQQWSSVPIMYDSLVKAFCNNFLHLIPLENPD